MRGGVLAAEFIFVLPSRPVGGLGLHQRDVVIDDQRITWGQLKREVVGVRGGAVIQQISRVGGIFFRTKGMRGGQAGGIKGRSGDRACRIDDVARRGRVADGVASGSSVGKEAILAGDAIHEDVCRGRAADGDGSARNDPASRGIVDVARWVHRIEEVVAVAVSTRNGYWNQVVHEAAFGVCCAGGTCRISFLDDIGAIRKTTEQIVS